MPSEDIRDIVGSEYIPLDAFFTPVKKVVYNIEKMLVEDNPNFEKVCNLQYKQMDKLLL